MLFEHGAKDGSGKGTQYLLALLYSHRIFDGRLHSLWSDSVEFMPMQRDRYPANWHEIALKIKSEADWKCEECGRECRKVGESLGDFVNRVVPKVHCPESYDLLGEISAKPTRFVLTVAHLNHIPEDCTRSNLKALCSACHCAMDLKAMARKKMLKREYFGQLSLFS